MGLKYYGCTRCQEQHFEGQPLYEQHIMWQDKHSVRESEFRSLKDIEDLDARMGKKGQGK